MHVLLYTPAAAKGPVPVFLVLHFNGNWAIVDDPGVRLHDTWDRKKRERVTPAADTKRGTSKEWDVPVILARGYGVAAIYYGDIEPDFDGGAGLPFGVRPLFWKPGQTERAPDEWGAIGAWAWGMSRALDYLRTDQQVDGKKVIAVGQSRLGKTVLWAGAQDQRFAMVIAELLGRRRRRPQPARLRREPRQHDLPLPLPVQRELQALQQALERSAGGRPHAGGADRAPPAAAQHRQRGQLVRPAGRVPGRPGRLAGLRAVRQEGAGRRAAAARWTRPLLRDLAFHEHTGRHAILATDWKVFLDFADSRLGRRPGARAAR